MPKRPSAGRPDVLVLSPHLAPPAGGVERLALDVADALAPRRVRVVGVSDASSDDPRLRIVLRRRGRLGGLRTTAAYAAAAIGEVRAKPRIVHAMTWRALLPALLVPRRPPLVLYCMGGELVRAKGGRAEVSLRRWVLQRATTLGAISGYTRDLVRTTSGRDAVVVKPPIRRMPAGPFERPLRHEVHVLAVGRLVQNKGHDRLIRAVALARGQGAALHLTVVGRGPEEPRLRALVHDLQLGDAVTLAGGVDDEALDALYRDADVFALLSVPVAGEVEGFGIVFLEANSYELPVVAGRSGGSTDAVDDGVSGIIVDDEETAAGALTALASDPPRRCAMGAAGRARLEFFSLAAFGDKLRAWHDGVLADTEVRP